MDFISTYLSFQSSYNGVLKAFNVLKLFVYKHVRDRSFITSQEGGGGFQKSVVYENRTPLK